MCAPSGVCIDGGFRSYHDAVSEDNDAETYVQQLRELQSYVTGPSHQPQPAVSPAMSTNPLPLLSVLSLPDETALRVRFMSGLRPTLT